MSVKEACKAVSNAKLKYVETHKSSDVRFRSKKAVRQSCYIPKSAINKEGFFIRTLGKMKYAEDIPVSVSINEAVELVKKYATSEDASFVNGLLGVVAREEQKNISTEE